MLEIIPHLLFVSFNMDDLTLVIDAFLGILFTIGILMGLVYLVKDKKDLF
jgi:hypothetical protein